MALLALLGLIRRQFIAMISGLALTGLALFYVHGIGGVYYAQVNYQLLAPPGDPDLNTYQDITPSLISTAGILSHTVNTAHRAQPVSQSVTLLGQGIQHGYSVRLPNYGGQWAYNFSRPVLNVEVTGTSEAEVQQNMHALLARMDANLLSMQQDFGASKKVLISSQLSPPVPQVILATGSPNRALGVTFLIGFGLTVLAASVRNRVVTRRRRLAEELADAGPAEFVDEWADPDTEDADGYDQDEHEQDAVPQLSHH